MSELVQIKGAEPKPGRRKGVYIRTFGCQMNEYDSEKLACILEQQYQRVDTPEAADLILINTCSVRDKPEQKLYSLLGEFRELKTERPNLLVGVGGCVAQQEGEKIVRRSSAVDFVFGTHNLSLVPALIERRLSGAAPQVAVDYRDEWEQLPLGFTGKERVSVFVSISRGCNKNCTYCIVPTTRGSEVSRSADEIEREIKIAVHRGAREVVLLGQTVNSWGLDLTPRRKFSQLLERVAAIEGLLRIRFTSPHPQEVRSDFISLLRDSPKICRHLHMPLQSGSNKILKAMNRNYRRERYLEIIEEARAAVPELAITTDIIVGFPGESEQDYLETRAVMDTVRFEDSYSFMFSPRPGTVAASMEDDVPADEKLRRLKLLQERQLQISAERLGAWVGRRAEILIDGPSHADPGKLQGRLSQNILVNLEESYHQLTPGQVVPVTITEACRFTLRGRLAVEPEQAVRVAL